MREKMETLKVGELSFQLAMEEDGSPSVVHAGL